MKSLLLTCALCTAMLALLPGLAQAQTQSIQAELRMELDGTLDKIISLAEALPPATYSWRPADGVRSISEALVHTASAAYFFGNMAGVTMPDGLNLQEAEQTVTSKDDVIEMLNEARTHVVTGVGALSDDALGSQADWFDGSKVSARRVLLVLSEHTSEHLGQLIAYARMNDVAPPWSGN